MPDIVEMLSLTQPISHIVIRSVMAFLALVLIVRVVPKRNASRISPNDMLILIIVGTIGADAITGEAYTVGDLLVMITIVLFLGYVLDFLEYHSSLFRRLIRHRQTLLVEDGKLLRRNMRQELVTEEEMMSVLRMEGIKNLTEVKSAILEADGEISVLRNGPDGDVQDAAKTDA